MKKLFLLILTSLFAANIVLADVFTAGDKVYFSIENNAGWASDGAKMTAYFFNGVGDDAWAGVEASSETATIYSLVIPGTNGKTWANIIFVRKAVNAVNLTSWTDIWNQTVDIPAKSGKYCYFLNPFPQNGNVDGIWQELNLTEKPQEPDAEVDTAKVEDLQKRIVVGVKKPADWAEIYVYYWNEDTAHFLKPLFCDTIYACGFDFDEVNFIFLAAPAFFTGNAANEEEAKQRLGKQTINIENVEESACYEIVAATYENGDSDWGKRRVNTLENCPFEQQAGAKNANSPDWHYWVENLTLTIRFDGRQKVSLYSSFGQLLFVGDVENSRNFALGKGVYLLKLGENAVKILVK